MIPPPTRTRAGLRTASALLTLGAGLLLSGCAVTVYQPLSTLQRPVVVDPRLGNFEGLRLLVRCVPGDHLDASASQLLCRQVSGMFRAQGAEVEVEVPRNGRSTRGADAPKPELTVDLSARLLDERTHSALTVASVLSLTLIPMVHEFSVAQDVKIRDASGFLLATDSLQARFIEYVGVGVYSVNWVLDVLVREDAEEMTGDAPKNDFSRDFYGQLSQLVFNARVRSVVLGGFAPAPSPVSTPAAN